jgi:cobalt-zinc-cadmium efflux system outer membrane protein
MSVHRITGLHGLVALALLGSALAARAEPLTREGAVALALRENPEIKAARAEWDAARARARVAWAPPDPVVEAEFEELERLGDPGDFGERSIGGVQTIEFPIKWWLNHKAADQRALAVQAAVFQLARLDVATRVEVAFDRVLSRQQVLSYETEHEILLQDFARRVRRRHEAGDVPELEALRSGVEAGRATSRVAATSNELSVARSQLQALLAQDNTTTLELKGTLGHRDVSLQLEDAQALGLRYRPDLQGALYEVESRRAQRGAVRAGLFPDLSVGVFRQTLRNAGAEEGRWRLAVALEVPLWGGIRQRGNLAEARAEVVGAQADAERLRRQVMLEIQTSYQDLMTATDQVSLFDERILHEAEQAQAAAARSYDEGKVSYLDVLSTQRTLLETRVEYADILFSYREALAVFKGAMGGELPE